MFAVTFLPLSVGTTEESLSLNQVFLHAADAVDYANAESIARRFQISVNPVTGNPVHAWAAPGSGNFVVIAVGSPTNNA